MLKYEDGVGIKIFRYFEIIRKIYISVSHLIVLFSFVRTGLEVIFRNASQVLLSCRLLSFVTRVKLQIYRYSIFSTISYDECTFV